MANFYKVQSIFLFFIIWWRQLEQIASMHYYATKKTTRFHSNCKKSGTELFCNVVRHAVQLFFILFYFFAFSSHCWCFFHLHLTDLFSYRGVLVPRSPSWGPVWCNRGVWSRKSVGKECKGRFVIGCKDNILIWFYITTPGLIKILHFTFINK